MSLGSPVEELARGIAVMAAVDQGDPQALKAAIPIDELPATLAGRGRR